MRPASAAPGPPSGPLTTAPAARVSSLPAVTVTRASGVAVGAADSTYTSPARALAP